ncbi:MAG: hypothetical protein EBY55_13600 [Gammaproteobacteria bacterium]|nr:hypothetical protein [Gammaproteobacteria bacterium]
MLRAHQSAFYFWLTRRMTRLSQAFDGALFFGVRLAALRVGADATIATTAPPSRHLHLAT